jgi:uncharacterized protein YxeA
MKTIILILVVGVIVFGGYYLINKNKTQDISQVVNQIESESPATEEPTSKKMSFSEFVKQSGSYQCSVKQSTSDFDSSGTVYVNDGRMRGEFETIAEGINIKSYIIMKDGFIYTWSSASPKIGFKMAIKTDVENANSQNYSWNPEQIGDYDCSFWLLDESQFAVPTNIKFNLTKESLVLLIKNIVV